MAERGAYLTGTAFIKPSVFEIIAQESFASTLEPALKKIFTFLVSCNPERYGHLLSWTNEAYMIFNAILQQHYFRKYSASFSEAFYGLKRIALVNRTMKGKMSKKQEMLSLILVVLFPYMKSKLSELRDKHKHEEMDGHIPQSKWQQWYRTCIIKGYAISFTLYETIVLYNYILYLSGRNMYPTPLLRLLSITLTYSDSQPSISYSELWRKMRTNTFSIDDGIDAFQSTITTSIEFGAFVLQFLAWWNQGENYANIFTLPIPPPPKISKIANQYQGMCPVCCKPQHIKTVLSVSGYVFCYQCALLAVRKSGKCPVTGYPAKEDDLIRLYIE